MPDPVQGGVSPEFLLEGIWYALQQAGHLLHGAVLLYNSGQYSSAVVLAAFGGEELGKSVILRDFRKKLVGGSKTVTLEDVRRACTNHITKQEKGMAGVMMRTEGGDALAKLLKTLIHPKPQSAEWREARSQVDALTAKLRKRTPQARHQQRMAALYVEPKEIGTGWLRPADVSQEEALRCVDDFGNDYAIALDRLKPGIYEATDPEFFKALQAWSERPELPAPQRPDWKKNHTSQGGSDGKDRE